MGRDVGNQRILGDRRRFAEMTKSDSLDKVHAGMDAAERAGLGPVKVNCVMMRGVNDGEAVDFARFARETGRLVRFIEYMPFAPGGSWDPAMVVPGEELYRQRLPVIGSGYSASPVAADGRIYLSGEDGDILTIAAGPAFTHLATNPMGEPLMATPALSDGVMYVRSPGTLFAVGRARSAAGR